MGAATERKTMARDHAEIYVDIWDDDDFAKLSCTAQWLYFVLLSQRRLEYSGVLPLKPAMWAGLSSDTNKEDVLHALAEMHERGFVVVDTRTQEVLLRSFFRRDVARVGKDGGQNANLIRSALSACAKVDSSLIRAVLVREIMRCCPLPLASDREVFQRFPDLAKGVVEGVPEGVGEPVRDGVADGYVEKDERRKEKGTRRKELGERSRQPR
jgi:hypothetical protein